MEAAVTATGSKGFNPTCNTHMGSKVSLLVPVIANAVFSVTCEGISYAAAVLHPALVRFWFGLLGVFLEGGGGVIVKMKDFSKVL